MKFMYIFGILGKSITNHIINKEEIMNSEKHIKVTGYSNISWKDAIVKTIDEASKTLSNLSNITVLEQRASISGNKIAEYMVDLDISFKIEPFQEQPNDDTDNM